MRRARAFLLVISIGLLAVACGGGSGHGASAKLAANQTLSFPLTDGLNVTSLDPAYASDAVSFSAIREMFGGLIQVDGHGNLVPYVAASMPAVSSDGLTYTFHLRHDARFSNGDAVTSQDVLYSWNRALATTTTNDSTFRPVVGEPQVMSGSATTMSGVTAPDRYTVVVKLQFPAGYWLDQIAQPFAALVDQRAVAQGGAMTWWMNPATAVGTGPFELTGYQSNRSLDLAPVRHWWFGSTGTLTQFHIDEEVNSTSAVRKYEAGGYDVIGFGGDAPPTTEVLRYLKDPTKRAQLHYFNANRTTWAGFKEVGNSPFAPKPGITYPQPTQGLGEDQGKAGRQSLSVAVNRQQVASIACANGATCTAATGGVLPSGVNGYLGANADPGARFDPAKAKAEYAKWDPDGSKIKAVTLEYISSATNDELYENVQAQLRSTLGFTLSLYPTDEKTLLADRSHHQPTMFYDSWGSAFNNPEDWFANKLTCGNSTGAGYCDPAMDTIVKQAEQKPLAQSLTQYRQAQNMLLNNNFGMMLDYSRQAYFIQPYVSGVDGNSFDAGSWTQVRILQH
ncbi:MAG: ABC transporter substrate-binding protein [Candidatus Dormiibacterota bacterium]